MNNIIYYINPNDESLPRLDKNHPLNPLRLKYTHDLIDVYQILKNPNIFTINPRPAEEKEILDFHTKEYLSAVKQLSAGNFSANAMDFNFGSGDNPVFRGMYDAAIWSTGASLKAAELLANSKINATINMSGGLHHAMPNHASGFCVFNDPVLAIKYLVRLGMRVAYVDIDCHHGDGVQKAFYKTGSVITISIHESGAYIFPGTGFTEEIGQGNGEGYSINLPLFPHTTDSIYEWAFQELVPPLVQKFDPDILVAQLGIDTHYLDPIGDMALTVQGFGNIVSELAKMAPKLLLLGGGGYNVQAVARAWTVALGIISGTKLPDRIPQSYSDKHDIHFLYDISPQPNIEMQDRAKRFAENSVMAIQKLAFPIHRLST